MEPSTSSVQSQYAHGSLLETIVTALDAASPPGQDPTVNDLAAVDEFHIRGREATRELLDDLSITSDSTVLDVGCGIGGSARLVAHEYGAQVLGVDLSEEYCEVARELSRLVGLDDRLSFRQGNALELPVESDQFDLALSEHVQMNIADKNGYVREMARALRPGGTLALYEIFSGRQNDRHFPVPWADDESVSFLASPDAFRGALEDAGLRIVNWQDRTDAGLAWFEGMLEKVRREGPPPVGLHLLMGGGAKQKMKNVVRNLQEERIVVASAVARKPE